MKLQMRMRMVLALLALSALMNPLSVNGHPLQAPLGIQIDTQNEASQQKEARPSKNTSSSPSFNGHNNEELPASLKEADVITQRARRSYKLPGNLDLAQFYTPQTSAEDGSELMTKKELEYEREKFLRLLSILESAQPAGGSPGGDLPNADAAAATELVIALMSNHPSRNKARSGHNKGNAAQVGSRRSSEEEPDWMDDPISIHRHRVARRANREADGEDDYYGYYNPRHVYKRVPGFWGNREGTPVYTLSELLSKAQRQDIRYPLRHRFLL